MRLSLLFFLTLSCFLGRAQNVKDIYVDSASNGKPFLKFLHEQEQQHQIDFIGDEKRLQSLSVTGIKERVKLMDFLNHFSFNVKPLKVNDRVIFLMDRSLLDTAANRDYIVLQQSADSKQTVSGVILDENNSP